MIALADLKDNTELEVLDHLANSYAGKDSGFSYYEIKYEDVLEAKNKLQNMEVLVAYESVGDFGCDSSGWFLLKEKTTGKLYEVNGSHCSCYGFEGQLDLEETTVETLKMRELSTGLYDREESENRKQVKEFIESL